MKLILFICEADSPQRKLKSYLPEEYVLLEEGVNTAGLQALKEITTGIVLADAEDSRLTDWIERARQLRADLPFVGVVEDPERVHPKVSEVLDCLLAPPFEAPYVSGVLEEKWEKSRLAFELHTLKNSSAKSSASASLNGVPNGAYGTASPQKKGERVLCEFSRALGNSFNRERLLELFMDSVLELAPVGRLSIVLKEENAAEYRVSFQRGLDPGFCSGLRFRPEKGLMRWLAEKGRILLVEEASAFAGSGDSEIFQELKLLQAEVSIPLQAHGRLKGSLNLGPKVTGAPFTQEELEILFILCSNVAVALIDIELHHQVLYQKSYIENILQRMGSGVVAINSEEVITACNSRAGEILSLDSGQLQGRDLRWLPSPLGDMLYETMSTGREYHKEECRLAREPLFLEVSTNQLLNEERHVLGSVMIFDDVSGRKQLEEEKRQADRLDVLNRFVGQLAHEIKNPMVAIQTFSELLPQKYEEDSFRDFFNTTVRQEVKRLNELVEQLIAFSSALSYRFEDVEVHEVLDMGLTLLREQGKGEETTVETSYTNGGSWIKADKTLLPRAISYLLRSSFGVVDGGGKLFIETRRDRSRFSEGGICISFWDAVTRASKGKLEILFDPLTAQQEDYISLELPVSKKIIEDHGGHVNASLKEGGYLAFEVLLPTISEGSETDG